MSIVAPFIHYILEARSKMKKNIVIRDGKKVVEKTRVYEEECSDGYKRDSETGMCVRMSPQERRDRSIAATKSANKSSTKRNKKISTNRRDKMIGESMTLARQFLDRASICESKMTSEFHAGQSLTINWLGKGVPTRIVLTERLANNEGFEVRKVTGKKAKDVSKNDADIRIMTIEELQDELIVN